MFIRPALAAALVSLTAAAADPPAEAPAGEAPSQKEPELRWEVGPGTVSMGGDISQLELTENEAFLDGPQSVKLMELMGNEPTRKEVGTVRPLSEDQHWFLVFEYDPVGYVKDDEKDKIDADGLFESLHDGTEESNDYRKEHGATPIHVIRWTESPHYDAKTHNLVWGILGRDDKGEEFVNWNVKVLGREGVTSVTLLVDPKNVDASKVAVEKLLARFSYKPGKTYSEWRAGDKVAEYGLTALVAAGAGAAAVKLGLLPKLFAILAKGGKAIILGLAAAGAAVARFFKRLFGGKPPNEGP